MAKGDENNMRGSIMHELEGVSPCGTRKRNASLSVMYRLVRKHLSEIEEAYSLGYSWRQIDSACYRAWAEHGGPASGIWWWSDGGLVEYCYHAVKKSSAARSSEATRR